jgi:glycosyltransferase involved in cell wall biosynthesis
MKNIKVLNDDLVSVIIPAYNCSSTITRCVESILMQTYPFIEIIIVNDGSTDDTDKILNEIKRQNSNVFIFNKKNGGASSARNFGINVANGSYITFVDADDYLEKKMINELVFEMKKKKVDLTICTLFQDYYQNGKLVKTCINNFHRNQKINLEVNALNLLEFIENSSINGPYCKLFLKRVLIENKIRFDEKLKIQEDLDFLLQYLLKINNLYLINKPMYHYVMSNSNSITSKFLETRYDNYLEVLKKVLYFYSKDNVDETSLERIKFMYVKNIYSSLLNALTIIDLNSRKTFFKKLIDKLDYATIKSAKRKGFKYAYLKGILLTKNWRFIYINCLFMNLIKRNFYYTYK